MTIPPPAMVKNGVFIRCKEFSDVSDWLCGGILSLFERNASRLAKKGSAVRVLAKRSGVGEKPVAYPMRYAEDFLTVSTKLRQNHRNAQQEISFHHPASIRSQPSPQDL